MRNPCNSPSIVQCTVHISIFVSITVIILLFYALNHRKTFNSGNGIQK